MYIRSNYLERLKQSNDKQIIKILTGVRRTGKSTIMEMFRLQLLAENVSPANIQFYNFEDLSLEDMTNYRSLNEKIESHLQSDGMNYIFLDEIQNVEQFEKVLDSLFIKKNVDLYVTGSNAYMLSGHLATLLAGRYIEIHVLPLSFKEYFQNQTDEPSVAFQTYLEKGGFPFTTQIDDEKTYKDYVNGIVNTVLIKDILTRKKRSDATLVEQLAKFLTDSAANLISVKKIADTLTSMGQKTSNDTISSYLSAFNEAFLFYKCDRYDIAGKKYLSINSKYYPVDQGLRKALLGSKRPNIGNRLETIVYFELIRRGYDVYVGIVGKLEIDFVAIKDGTTSYYQVAYSVGEEATYQREVASLKQINDHYRKYLLTSDLGTYNDEGIEQKNIIDWLLEDKH